MGAPRWPPYHPTARHAPAEPWRASRPAVTGRDMAPHTPPAAWRAPDRRDPAGSDGVAEPALHDLPAGRRAGLLPSADARPDAARARPASPDGGAHPVARVAHA